MSQALQKRPATGIATQGSFANAREASERLKEIAEAYNLVSPATSVGALPEGCEVVLSHVFVDTKLVEKETRQGKRTVSESGDIYPVEGKYGLSRNVLNKIAAAAGITWHFSGRVDDGSDPHYCHWRVEGSYRAFDGQVQRLVGNKQMDLRAESKQLAGKSDKQVDQMRQFIMEHAESKAKNRAVREAFGLKSGYTLDELAKPFVAARVMFTGRSADPETQRMFNQAIAASFLDSSRQLFGSAQPEPRRLAPPPVDVDAGGGSDSGEFDMDPDSGEVRKPAQTSEAEAQTGDERKLSGYEMPFGHAAGTPIEEATTADLAWMASHLRKQLDAKKSRFPKKDEALLAAIQAEVEAREDVPGDEY